MTHFDDIFDAYYADVYRFLLKLCARNADLAEELAQESFFYAFMGFHTFREECHVKTWLFGIAKKRYLLYLRRHKHLDIPLEDALPFLYSEDTPESGIYDRKLIEDSLTIVFTFKENMKYVFLERIYNGTAYSEIAKQLGISESSAKVMFHRGKQLLRKTLREEYGYDITV